MLISPHGSHREQCPTDAAYDSQLGCRHLSLAVKRSVAKETSSANHDIDTFPSPLLYSSLHKPEGLQQPWAKPGREFP